MKKMSVTGLMLLNVAAVLSLRGLPAQAEEGYAVIFYLLIGAALFFIPSALISAELAGAWQKEGGVYLWVKEAFGPRVGFLAIFMQWVENLPWFPSMITMIATGIAYMFKPELATNKYYVFAMIIGLLWLATFINTRGMSWSSFLSSTGATFGVLIPGGLLIVFGAAYLFMGNAPAIAFSPEKLLPDLSNMNQLMLLVGMLVGLAGIELSAVHVTEVDNPGKNFPKAIIMAAVIIVALNILASLAIALTVKTTDLNVSSGLFDAYNRILTDLNLTWLTPIMYFLLSYGAMATVVTWVLGPSMGLLEVAKDGYLPKAWQKRNANGAPVTILIIQAISSSVLALSVLFMPSVADAFWLMTALTAQLYLVMYVLMFSSAIKLRYSKPDVERPYKVPGGKPGMWLFAGSALVCSFAAIVFGFFPPDNVKAGGTIASVGYIAFLLIGLCVFIAIPYVLYARRDKRET